MSELVIETRELTKRYQRETAVDALSLSVERGSIHGFLGRNGSGKTTTIKILLGLASPTAGEARVFGLRPRDRREGVKIRERVGFVSEDKWLPGQMRVEQLIAFTRSFYPRWDPALEARLQRSFRLPLAGKIRSLSKGMRTKLALFLALPRGADLLVLDEPTAGLDPEATEEVLQLLVGLASTGTTIFFSSHQLNEVEQIADHVTIIDHGRVKVSGELDDLKDRYRRVTAVFDREVPDQLLAPIASLSVKRDGRVLSVLTPGRADELVDRAHSFQAISVEVAPVTLKEIFLEG